MAGYHVADIPKGEMGSVSKIREEFLEFNDAINQGNKVMALHEMSDILGAMEAFLETFYHGAFSLTDLMVMMEATKRAFETGHRT
jgi:hypothetical protein